MLPGVLLEHVECFQDGALYPDGFDGEKISYSEDTDDEDEFCTIFHRFS